MLVCKINIDHDDQHDLEHSDRLRQYSRELDFELIESNVNDGVLGVPWWDLVSVEGNSLIF